MGRAPLPEEMNWFLSEGFEARQVTEIFEWYPNYGGILYQNRAFFETLKIKIPDWWSSFFETFYFYMFILSKMITSRETLEVVCGYLLDLCRLLGHVRYMTNILYKEVKSFEDLKRIVEFEKKKARTTWLTSYGYPSQPDNNWLDDPLSCLLYDNQDIFLQIETAIGKENMQEFCKLLYEFREIIKTKESLEAVRDIAGITRSLSVHFFFGLVPILEALRKDASLLFYIRNLATGHDPEVGNRRVLLYYAFYALQGLPIAVWKNSLEMGKLCKILSLIAIRGAEYNCPNFFFDKNLMSFLSKHIYETGHVLPAGYALILLYRLGLLVWGNRRFEYDAEKLGKFVLQCTYRRFKSAEDIIEPPLEATSTILNYIRDIYFPNVTEYNNPENIRALLKKKPASTVSKKKPASGVSIGDLSKRREAA